MKKTQC